jgi:hypothetical protein
VHFSLRRVCLGVWRAWVSFGVDGLWAFGSGDFHDSRASVTMSSKNSPAMLRRFISAKTRGFTRRKASYRSQPRASSAGVWLATQSRTSRSSSTGGAACVRVSMLLESLIVRRGGAVRPCLHIGVRQSYLQIRNSQGPFAEFLDGRGIAQDFPPPRPINPLPPIPLVSNIRLNHTLKPELGHAGAMPRRSRIMSVQVRPVTCQAMPCW